MADVKLHLDLIRKHLRERIFASGVTQLEVQRVLGWGSHAITSLVHGRRPLRVEQVLMILKVIDVTPAEFFGEVYGFDSRPPAE